MEHLFDAPDVIPEQKEEPYQVSKLLDDTTTQTQSNAKAAIEDVKVKSVEDEAEKKRQEEQAKEPIMPKTMEKKVKHKKTESEIEKAIRMAENAQSDEDTEAEQED